MCPKIHIQIPTDKKLCNKGKFAYFGFWTKTFYHDTEIGKSIQWSDH